MDIETIYRIPFDADCYFVDPNKWKVISRKGLFVKDIYQSRQSGIVYANIYGYGELSYHGRQGLYVPGSNTEYDLFMIDKVYLSITTSDQVNSPDHYTSGGIETIDYLQAKLSSTEFTGYLKGNVLKYLSRSDHKGGTEDLKKAQWYLNKLIDVLPK